MAQSSVYRVTLATPPGGSSAIERYVVAESPIEALGGFDTAIGVTLLGPVTIAEKLKKGDRP